eukprot:TRINITY_DN2068_c1_g1_i1.p1 TRINITY_DN2068_c1_g1~~TRINITY_DN2068_c1_g1_i1.p1  ORF type:complete len:238 (+),score=71.25 TRINITY_DN2068_c1_g1_i1:42-755(+)
MMNMNPMMGGTVAIPSAAPGGENAGKIFVGALPKNCSNEALLAWASQFGAVVSAEVKVDTATGMPRGFGFVTYQDPSVAQAVIANNANNVMDGKKIDCKAFGVAKGADSASLNDPNNPKIFIGGLPKTSSEEALRAHFGQYGEITDLMVKKGPDGMCAGFGFVTFADAASAKMILDNYDHNMFEGKWIDCKSAVKGSGKGDKSGMMSMMMGMMSAMMGMKGKGKGCGFGKGKGWGPY